MFTSYEEKVELPEDEIEYAVWQKERCPTTGRIHNQGFVRFHTRKRFSSVKKLFGDSVHIEYARCVEKAIAYCMKEDSRVACPIEIGVRPEPRKRKINVIEELKKCTPLDLIQQQPQIWRSLKQLQNLHCALVSPRTKMTEGVFLSGATGTGKSRICQIISGYLGYQETFWAPADLKWMDGYSGQKLVIIDEFRGGVPPSRILRLIDRYPYQVEVKGGFTQWKPVMILMTSNLGIHQCFPEDCLTKQAIERRIKEYIVY